MENHRASGGTAFAKVPHVEVILGPPGTGKTSSVGFRIQQEIDAGTLPERIAAVSFTRAAVYALTARLGSAAGGKAEGFVWARTIHSMAFKLLGLKTGRVMGADQWREFADRHRYDLSTVTDYEDGITIALPLASPDDDLRCVVEWGSNNRVSLAVAHSRCPVRVDGRQLRLFAERLVAFKAENGLYGFADVLEECLRRGLRPPVDVAFIDEAQDLSPLQIACVESWFADCDRVVIVGDDDQSVYTFQGADPRWMLGLAAAHPTTVLKRSYRLPGAVHALALQIVSHNRQRISKDYLPAQHDGEIIVIDRDELPGFLDGAKDTFVLARNRATFVSLTHELLDRQVPYLVEGPGGICPLRDQALVEAVEAAVGLSKADRAAGAGLKSLLRYMRPGDVPKAARERRLEHLSGEHEGSASPEELAVPTVGDLVRSVGPIEVLGRVAPEVRTYLAGLLEKYGRIPDPTIRLMTIHASKGREADQVVVLPNMGRRSHGDLLDDRWGGREAEYRIAYVALTRAKTRLVLVRPTSSRFFPYEAEWRRVETRRGRGW